MGEERGRAEGEERGKSGEGRWRRGKGEGRRGGRKVER